MPVNPALPVHCAAYGSNLHSEDLRGFLQRRGHRCGVPPVVGNGWLVDRALGFRRRSVVRAGGVLDVMPALGHATPAVLMACSPAHWDALDDKEGTQEGHYRRAEALFAHEDGRVEPCMTYEVVNREPPTVPAPAYAQVVREGFAAHGLDAAVLERAIALDGDASLVRHLFVRGAPGPSGARHAVLQRVGAVFLGNAVVSGRTLDAGSHAAAPQAGQDGAVEGGLWLLPAVHGVVPALETLDGAGRASPRKGRVVLRVASGGQSVVAWGDADAFSAEALAGVSADL